MVSVIVPVYNAEKYLYQAIDSVLSQTYSEWELILVDDGSTDSSGKLCEMYARKSSKVKVIHKTNGGLSSARNAGIKRARGNYILFLDADDILASPALELLLSCVSKKGCDIVCGKIKDFISSLKLYSSRDYMIPSLAMEHIGKGHDITKTFLPEKALENILYQKNLNNSVCGKLFSSNLFENLRFREDTGYEDLDIISPLLLKANKVAVIDLPLYHYRQHPESYVHTFSLKRADVLDVTQRLSEFIKDNCPELLPAARSRQLSANFNVLGLIAANRNKIIEEEKDKAKETAYRCWNKIKELRVESLRNPSVRLKNKLGILASYIGGRPFVETLSKIIYR